MVREPDVDSWAGRRRLGTRVAAAVAVLLLAPVAACSSSKPSNGSSSASAIPSATVSASPSATAPADEAAARTQITQVWQKFFSPSTPLADKAALLQNGAAYQQVLQGFSRDPRVGQVQAKVTKVDFTSATAATVTYALNLKGTPVLPNATGQAVQQNGSWKVADSTLCSLLALSGGSSGAAGASGGSMGSAGSMSSGSASSGIPGC